jgi:hypothetical protein
MACRPVIEAVACRGSGRQGQGGRFQPPCPREPAPQRWVFPQPQPQVAPVAQPQVESQRQPQEQRRALEREATVEQPQPQPAALMDR